MIKLKKGECHPIFSVKYLAENIASLVETTLLFVELSLITIFLLNFLIKVIDGSALDNLVTVLINVIPARIFASFKTANNQDSNFLALLSTGLLYFLTYKYFEFVKYNLHPRKTKTPKGKLLPQ